MQVMEWFVLGEKKPVEMGRMTNNRSSEEITRGSRGIGRKFTSLSKRDRHFFEKSARS